MTDAKDSVLTLVKIKHKAPETRPNKCLTCVSRLEQMRVELTDEHMEAHCGVGSSFDFFAKSSITLRHNVCTFVKKKDLSSS